MRRHLAAALTAVLLGVAGVVATATPAAAYCYLGFIGDDCVSNQRDRNAGKDPGCRWFCRDRPKADSDRVCVFACGGDKPSESNRDDPPPRDPPESDGDGDPTRDCYFGCGE